MEKETYFELFRMIMMFIGGFCVAVGVFSLI